MGCYTNVLRVSWLLSVEVFAKCCTLAESARRRFLLNSVSLWWDLVVANRNAQKIPMTMSRNSPA